MPTFYYLAVGNADNRKIYGETEAENEAVARRELNRMGMSVLTVGTQPLQPRSETVSRRSFEFEACDKSGKAVVGTIEAENDEQAYDRLLAEFGFSVSYLCAENASAAEKEAARAAGIQPILDAKKLRAEKEAARKKTLVGRLGSFVKMEEKTLEEALPVVAPATPAAPTPKKLALSLDDEPIAPAPPKTAPAAESPAPRPAAKLGLALEADEPAVLPPPAAPAAEPVVAPAAEPLPPQAAAPEPPAELPAPAAQPAFNFSWDLDLAKLWAQISASWSFFQDTDASAVLDSSEPKLPWDEQFWLLLRFVFGTLTGLYLTYLLLAFLALHYNFGAFSELAKATLLDDQFVPFCGLAALLLWLTLLAREHFTVHRTLRFGLLLGFTVLTLLILQINVL